MWEHFRRKTLLKKWHFDDFAPSKKITFETVSFPTIGKSHFLKSVIFLMPRQQKGPVAKVIISSVANIHFVVKTFPQCVKTMFVKALSRLCHSMRTWFLCLRAHTGKSATGLCWQCFRNVLNWYRNFSGPLSLCFRDITGPALVIVAIVVWRRLISLHGFKIVRVLLHTNFYEESAQKWHEFPGFAGQGNAWIPNDFDGFSKTLRFLKHSVLEK